MTTRPESKPGPTPIVLTGFTWDATTNTATWAPDTPAKRVLDALSIGASWAHAATYARLNQATPRQWNTRGRSAFANFDGIDSFAATDPDQETLAYVAFHVLASAARGAPVVGALEQIDRARRAGDWKAAAHMLKILPGAKDYRPTLEVSGPDGEAIPVEVRAANIAAAARSYQGDTAPDEADE